MIDALATNLVFQPLNFSRNRLEAIIDPADTSLTDRSGLRYALTLLVPTFPQSTDLMELTTLVGRERPPQTVAGAVRYDGAQFRIDEVLDGFLETQKPTFRQMMIGSVPTLTMPYCRREAVSGGTPAVNTSVTRPKEWIFKGGLTNEDFAGWNSRFFDQYLSDTRQFLTWQPTTKAVSAAAMAEEYLYFLLNFSPMPTQLRLKADIYYTDGHSETRTLLTLDQPSLYSAVCCPVGVSALGLVNVSQYRVWLSNEQDWRLSEVRTFVVDLMPRVTERFVLFENSLGGFDTLRLLGQGEKKPTVRRTTVETDPFGASAGAIDFPSMRVVSTEGDSTLTVSTGYFERDAAQWTRYLDELILSKNIYLITEKGHVALLLTTSEVLVHDDNADLLARTLVFQKAKTEQNFSRMPATAPGVIRATGWRGSGFRLILDGMGKRTGMGTPARLRQYYLDTGTDVKPITEKLNVQGSADYINPTPVPGVTPGDTPYPNTAISRTGSYKRSNCPSGQEGGFATITIPAGKYGGEALGDANALAEAEFRARDTQPYADANGACTLSQQENYTWAVPDGQWHIRFNLPNQLAIYHFNAGAGFVADMGNTQSLQGQSGQFIYPAKSNDLNFPVNGPDWDFFIFGSPGAVKQVKLYRNGTLLYTTTVGINNDGYQHLSLLVCNGTTYVLSSGDKLYLKYEDQ